MKTNTNRPNILLIDDSRLNLDYICDILKDSYCTHLAQNGRNAFEILDKQEIDLILLDVIMPEMDGFEVCRKIKQDCKTKDIPVIFLTSLSNTDDIVKGFVEGGVDYIPKPFQKEELLVRIQRHIEYKKTQDKINSQLDELRKSNRYLMGAMHEMSKMMVDPKSEEK
jgi:PleD family two-component response regulator